MVRRQQYGPANNEFKFHELPAMEKSLFAAVALLFLSELNNELLLLAREES